MSPPCQANDVEHASPGATKTTPWRHVSRLVLPLLLILALLAGGLAGPALAASGELKALPQLQDEANAAPAKTFRVIVQRATNDTKAESAVKSQGGTKVKDIQANAFVATVSGGKLGALAKDPSIKYITLDAPIGKSGAFVDPSKLGTLYPQVVKAAGLWSSSAPLTGKGVGVAVLDTGMNTSRADWKDSTGASRIATSVIFNSNTKATNDGHGHGTHVAGIVGGNSWFDSGRAGKYIGVAPEARLINVKVSDDTGMAYISDVVNAIEWVIANRTTYNIRVINLSLISSVGESSATSILSAAVQRAWFNGIFVVVAAGNGGPNTMYYPPANDPFVVTVGAADPMGTVAQADDIIAPWSSYGTTQDGYTKPDVVAPGRYMVSVLSSSTSTLAKAMPERIVDSTYFRLSGTSMAAPVVAGLAALAFEAHPEWTNDQVKWLVMNTATKLGSTDASGTFTPLPGSGAGEVDAAKVALYSGTPGFANQGLPLNLNLVTSDGSVVYNSAVWSTASWSTASWSTASWSTASWSTASWSTSSNFE